MVKEIYWCFVFISSFIAMMLSGIYQSSFGFLYTIIVFSIGIGSDKLRPDGQ